jgi:aldehyde:ferredoxin oxidoreductase
MKKGFTGKLLHVDLTAGKTSVENPPESFYRKYIGGSMMGLYYILKNVPPQAEPLEPENVLTCMLSPLTGVAVSGLSRVSINAKSPLVEGIGDSQAGGFFPAELKFADFDGIIIHGRADHPVYLWVKDGDAEIRDARHLWGKTTGQVEDQLKQELEDNHIQIAQCGPAGEKLVRLAAVINYANRANGRTGMGAVMGSKNLKAIVVRGSSKKVPVAHSDLVKEFQRESSRAIRNHGSSQGLQKDGTAGGVRWQHLSGTLPTRNYNEGQFEGYEAIAGDRMSETLLKDNDTCYACAVRCKRVIEAEWKERNLKPQYGGPEYETVATFGSYCGVDDLKAVGYANQLCNQHGLDTIGTGATIAWAMECFQNGILTEEEIGFPLKFGDAEAMVKATEMLAKREGFGDILAEGSRRAADALGKGHQFLITVKGSELPAHMPRVKRSLGLIYAVNPFGADHQSSEHDPGIEEGTSEQALSRLGVIGIDQVVPQYSLGVGKIHYAHKTHQYYSFVDSADMCQFVFGLTWVVHGPEDVLELTRVVTGWDDFDIDELLLAGERRLNMMRAFNMREGLDRSDDTLPKKLFEPMQGTGPSAEMAYSEEKLEFAKDEYYQMSGWDPQTGNPTRETLADLGLSWVLENNTNNQRSR